MKRLLMSAAIAALAVPAFAQDTAEPETAVEETAQAAEDAASDAADATADAADATADAAGDAADAAGDATMDAADATADAADDAADAAGEAAADADAAADAAGDAAADAEMTDEATDMEATDMDAAEGEMVEGEMAEEVVAAPTEAQPDMDPAKPSMLASWVEGLQVFTTNEPSGSEWSVLEGDAIPEGWDDIADIGDIVINSDHEVVGYVIDIGGFLGIGAKEVLVSTEAAKMGTFGNDTVFVTNYTKEELGALPDFDDSMMIPAVLSADDAAAVDGAVEPMETDAVEGEAEPANN
ncbi:hypothetical protein [Paracoccus tegillarcae]|uniref:hypothetical protein n=1 Tax=Paracoccus tegillarcae TaxID=1529068 RepID=UPI0018E69260|nr:hypothetical protein [Paracoccus tegillarcae]